MIMVFLKFVLLDASPESGILIDGEIILNIQFLQKLPVPLYSKMEIGQIGIVSPIYSGV
jgi:hypothetical protein